MQYVSGGSLADLLKSEGPLDWQRAARYVADVGEGLLEVHEQGIVHRDVKPANILWDPSRDEALLTDFGVRPAAGRPGDRRRLDPLHGPRGIRRPGVAVARRLQPGRDVLPPGHRLGAVPRSRDRRSEESRSRRGLPDPDPRCAGLPEPLERIIRAGLTASPDRRPGLKDFVATLAGTSLNRCLRMADTLSIAESAGRARDRQSPGLLSASMSAVIVRRRPLSNPWRRPIPQPDRLTRDMKTVPTAPRPGPPADRRTGAHRGRRRPRRAT